MVYKFLKVIYIEYFVKLYWINKIKIYYLIGYMILSYFDFKIFISIVMVKQIFIIKGIIFEFV